MKKILTIFSFLTLFVFSAPLSLAATPTPTKGPTQKMPSDTLTKEITNLKEKIASRVAELKLVEKRGVIGVVTEVKDTQITLNDIKGNTRFVDVDELTKFIGSDSKETSDISDITKGMKITVLGRYNKQSQRLLARFVKETSIPEFLSGTIKTIDTSNFAFTLADGKGKSTDVDVENLTKTQTYTREDGLTKAGFSKLQAGDQLIVSGFPDKNNPKRIVATRVLILSDFRAVDADTEAASPSPTTSTTRKSATPTPEQ